MHCIYRDLYKMQRPGHYKPPCERVTFATSARFYLLGMEALRMLPKRSSPDAWAFPSPVPPPLPVADAFTTAMMRPLSAARPDTACRRSSTARNGGMNAAVRELRRGA